MTSTERIELSSAVAHLLQDLAPIDSVESASSTADGYDRTLWSKLAEYGFIGLLIPESFGGGGAALADAILVAIELGRLLVPGPYVTSAVESSSLLAQAGDNEACASLLEALAEGTAIAAVLDEVAVRRALQVAGDPRRGLILNGSVPFAVGADRADVLLVPLTLDDDTTVVLNVRATDVTVVPTGLSDATRRAATITFTDLHVPAADVLLSGPRARAAVDLSHARLAVALAADSAGGAAASLALATEYAKTRHQFGRAIGSFQAIKHKLADMYIGADSALAMATQAAEMLDTNPEHAYKAVLAAAAHCTAAYVSIAGDAIQIHGGIGFTWEHVCHRFLKRAWLNQTMLGGQRKLRLAFADSLFAGA